MQIDAAHMDAEATYRLLTGLVVPRPIAWITSMSDAGVLNLAPFSAFTFVSAKPPMLGVNIGRKAGLRKDTGNNLLARREYVVHIGDSSHTRLIHESSAELPAEASEVALLGLATAPSETIAVPRLADVPVAMECRLHQVIPFGDTGSEFFVGEVLRFHLRDGLMRDGKVDTRTLDPVCRIAGPNYATLGEITTLRVMAQTTKTVIGEGGG